MSHKPHKPPVEFKTRMPVSPAARSPGPAPKRSGHVALFLMGTLAVGTAAYTLMPANKCEQSPNTYGSTTECPTRSSSSSGGSGGSGSGSSSRTSYYSSDSSSSHSSSSTSTPGSSSTTRGGFGSFGHAFGFSGG